MCENDKIFQFHDHRMKFPRVHRSENRFFQTDEFQSTKLCKLPATAEQSYSTDDTVCTDESALTSVQDQENGMASNTRNCSWIFIEKYQINGRCYLNKTTL